MATDASRPVKGGYWEEEDISKIVENGNLTLTGDRTGRDHTQQSELRAWHNQ
ncbi:MAG TPA: hypothetical protein VH325_07880 [Bryobacteraceae bacterium]|jgi:hypothetical protein|nr:hypothetical protein [Bryobacteraceae bacterium]